MRKEVLFREEMKNQVMRYFRNNRTIGGEYLFREKEEKLLQMYVPMKQEIKKIKYK